MELDEFLDIELEIKNALSSLDPKQTGKFTMVMNVRNHKKQK